MTLSKQQQAVIDEAHWVIDHASGWLYEETRPIPLARIKAGTLPIRTDCSGSAIGISYRAGVSDPSGNGYNGEGNTDSFYAHCQHLAAYTDCKPGDLIDVGNSTGTTHVYLVVEKLAGGDYLVFSHGGPTLRIPPRLETLSGVRDYWYGRGYRFAGLRYLDMSVPVWHVLDGGGKLIGKTAHPAIWGTRHPHTFRNNQTVKFVRRDA